MRKRSIKNWWHYGIKSFVLLMPLIMLLMSFYVTPSSATTELPSGSNSVLDITYKYQTNSVNSPSDLVVGNAYYFDFDDLDSSSVGSIDLHGDVDFNLVNGTNAYLHSYHLFTGSPVPLGSNIYEYNDNYYYLSTYVYYLDTSTSSFVRNSTYMKLRGGTTTITVNPTSYPIFKMNGEYYMLYSGNSMKLLHLDDNTYSDTSITFTGLPSSFNSNYYWYDALGNIFYTYQSKVYKLSTSTYEFSLVNSSAPYSTFTRSYFWYFDNQTYYTSNGTTYLFDSSSYTFTHVTSSFSGVNLGSFRGDSIFVYDNIPYYFAGTTFCYLDTSTLTWKSISSNIPMTTVATTWFFEYNGEAYFISSSSQYKFEILSSFSSLNPSSVVNGVYIYNGNNSFVDVSFIRAITDTENTILSATISSGSDDDSSSVENTDLIISLYNWFDKFRDLDVNGFYTDTLDILGFDLSVHTPMNIVMCYPLWVMWVFIFDLLLDFMIFIPKIAHNWLEKLFNGGGADE